MRCGLSIMALLIRLQRSCFNVRNLLKMHRIPKTDIIFWYHNGYFLPLRTPATLLSVLGNTQIGFVHIKITVKLRYWVSRWFFSKCIWENFVFVRDPYLVISVDELFYFVKVFCKSVYKYYNHAISWLVWSKHIDVMLWNKD